MPFQRSYSKVWWGSDNQLPAMPAANGNSFTSGGFYSYLNQHQSQQQQFASTTGDTTSGYHSLDYNNFKSYSANLSRIQEVDDEQNVSKLTWEKHDSPGSLRSQDSGFSDNDESHSTRSLGGRSSKPASPSTKSNASAQSAGPESPTSAQSIATPPTVVRRVGKSSFYSSLVSVSRRISFTGSPASGTDASTKKEELDASIEGAELMAELDSMQLVSGTPIKSSDGSNENECNSHAKEMTVAGCKQKRRRHVSRKPTKPLTPTKRRTMVNVKEDDSEEDDVMTGILLDEVSVAQKEQSFRTVPEYNNETVYLGGEDSKSYNNETVILGGSNYNDEDTSNNEDVLSPLKYNQSQRYTASTSTPKAGVQHLQSPTKYANMIPAIFAARKYANPLLNGHSPALQTWLDDLRSTYEQEVMSTLQTKSIAQEAFKNLTITTNTVAKLIRQLQQRAIYMQSEFINIERILTGVQSVTLHEALTNAEKLVESIAEFTLVLERRSVFFTDSRIARKRYEDNIEQIKIITKDTRYSLEKQHYISLESLLDDLQVLKRYLLITVRLVFEKMVRVIVQSIENGRCDLMLRANINMIATLTNIDYEGFASLTDAFVQNEAVRALLMVCLDNKLSSVRALALRALATICCAPEAIVQLGACGGIEIIRDIMQVQTTQRGGAVKRSDAERREAVSLLTQITAIWHGPEHRVDGLKDCAETIVEGLTQLVVQTNCSQTLLLCAAALNNLSRMEVTSHYSIMSNEAIFKLIEAVERREETVSIFLYEQIVAMLHNMSLNKKCHSHLANGSIINFITSAYQTEFYKSYGSRAESDAQRRTIKAILHMLSRLIHDSSLGLELLEQQRIPAFFKMAALTGNAGASESSSDSSQLAFDSSHSRDLAMLARELLLAQKQDQQQELMLQQPGGGSGDGRTSEAAIECEPRSATTTTSGGGGLKFNLSRQESYV